MPSSGLGLRVVLIAALWFGLMVKGHAQEPGADAAPESVAKIEIERLEDLVTTLESQAEREAFLARLKALIAAADGVPDPTDIEVVSRRLFDDLVERVDLFVQSMVDTAETIVDLPDLLGWMRAEMLDPGARHYWIELLGKVAATLALGTLAYRGVRRLIAPRRERLGEVAGISAARRTTRLFRRVALDLLPVVAFGAIGYGALLVLRPLPETQLIAVSLIKAGLTTLCLLVVARALLSPRTPALRQLPLTDQAATYLYLWVRRFGHVIVYSFYVLQNELLLRIPTQVFKGLKHSVGLVVAVMVVVFIAQNRQTLATWLRGEGTNVGQPRAATAVAVVRHFLARSWHFLAIAYVIGTYVVWALQLPGGFMLMFRGAVVTTALLIVAQPLIAALDRLLGGGFALGEDLERRYPGLQGRIDRYVGLIQRLAAAVVYLLALFIVFQVWELDLIGWIRGTLGTDLLDRLLQIGFSMLVIMLIWEASGVLIESYLQTTDETGALMERSGRARTLLPLLRTLLLVLVAIIILLHAMSTLGVDVAPLLATAGVIGIAIGFGSQKLVQDVINGVFILFQDTISVGEFVEVAGHSGTVERMSVRTVELRDVNGTVHTVPFSEITTVQNWSKEFGYTVLDVTVAYREDVDEVIEVLRQLGAELEADPRFGQFVLEPIDVWGLDSFADSAVVIRARIKTKPLKQWYIKREFNRLMKRRFDQLGIEIPFPHQTVYFGEDKAGRKTSVDIRVVGTEAAGGATPTPASGLSVVEPSEPAPGGGKS